MYVQVEALLRYGADPKASVSEHAGTALDIALQAHSDSIVSLLRDPQYVFIPALLHMIGMEQYVRTFVQQHIEPEVTNTHPYELTHAHAPSD